MTVQDTRREKPWSINDGYRHRLQRLSPQTHYAIRAAVVEWITVAQSEGYEPIAGWDNAVAEIMHSALLNRLLSGKRAFVERPPVVHAYPDYDAMERGA